MTTTNRRSAPPQRDFELMILTFEQAAADIEAGKGEKAFQRVTSLPEPIYERALAYRKRNKFGYLIRYVLHFLEMQSSYCMYHDYIPRDHAKIKKGALRLSVYRLAYLGLELPAAVSMGKKIVYINPNTLSTPYQPVRQRKGQVKPTPLFS